MPNNEAECTVTVVEHPQGVSQRCCICKKILAKGKYTAGIILTSNASNQSYFVSAPQTICCGEIKVNLIFLTDNLLEAEKKADEVATIVNCTGDTSRLSLVHSNLIVPPDPKAN